MNRLTRVALPMSPQRHINGCEGEEDQQVARKRQAKPARSTTVRMEPIRLRTRPHDRKNCLGATRRSSS